MQTAEYFNKRLAVGYRSLGFSGEPKKSKRRTFKVVEEIAEIEKQNRILFDTMSNEFEGLTINDFKRMPMFEFLLKFDTMIKRIKARREAHEKAMRQSRQKR